MEYRSNQQRVSLHVAFWLCYTLLYAIISTSFAPPSDLAIPMPWRLIRFWGYELGMLPLKLVAVYGLLYFLLPRYLIVGRYFQAVVIAIFVLIPLLFLYRFELYYIMYPLLYGEHPKHNPIEARRLLFSLLEFVPALAVAATIKLLRQHLMSQRREQQLIREKLQSELNYLKAQTNPHFLFNTLNNIYALARRNAPNTPEVIMKLSKILRFMLYECNQKVIAIEDELKIVKDYIALEELRYNDRLQIEYFESIDDPQQAIAPLLLLPLVENAFKHGVSESRFASKVYINVKLVAGKLSFEISNEYDASHPFKEEGIGIANVRRQLELIYRDQHAFQIYMEQEQFKIELKIQLNRAL